MEQLQNTFTESRIDRYCDDENYSIQLAAHLFTDVVGDNFYGDNVFGGSDAGDTLYGGADNDTILGDSDDTHEAQYSIDGAGVASN